MKPRASCVVLLNDSGQVLAASRRGNPNDFNLVGGKVEPSESPEEAAIRECQEETGITPFNLVLLYQCDCHGGDKVYETFTYLANFSEIDTLLPEEGIRLKWLDWPELINNNNTFSEYNNEVFCSYIRHLSEKED